MSIDIALDAPDLTNLPQRERSEAADLAILHGRAPGEDELIIYFSQAALAIIDRHGLSDPENEVGGFLLGQPYIEDGRLCIEVVTAIPANTSDSGPVHFTLTADSWSDAHDERETDHPDLKIVGWFHTHPDLGVFFSADDRVVQHTAFTQPWQVGLVVDPIRNEAACFGWTQERTAIEPTAGFYEMRDESQMSVISWRAASRTGLANWWQKVATETLGEGGSNYGDMVAQPSQPESLNGALRRGLYAGIIALLIGGLTAILLFIPLAQRNNDLERSLIAVLESQHAPLYAAEGLTCLGNGLLLTEPAIDQTYAVGEQIQFWGIADQDWATRYQIEARRIDGGSGDPLGTWEVIEKRRLDQPLGRIGRWSTADLPAGHYEIRLVSLMRGGAPDLDGACHSRIELVESSVALGMKAGFY